MSLTTPAWIHIANARHFAISSVVRFRLLSSWMFRFCWDHCLPCGIINAASSTMNEKGPFSAWFQSETIIYIVRHWWCFTALKTTLVLIAFYETTHQPMSLLHQSIVRSSDAAERKWFLMQLKQKSNQQREHVRVSSAHRNLVNVSFKFTKVLYHILISGALINRWCHWICTELWKLWPCVNK